MSVTRLRFPDASLTAIVSVGSVGSTTGAGTDAAAADAAGPVATGRAPAPRPLLSPSERAAPENALGSAAAAAVAAGVPCLDGSKFSPRMSATLMSTSPPPAASSSRGTSRRAIALRNVRFASVVLGPSVGRNSPLLIRKPFLKISTLTEGAASAEPDLRAPLGRGCQRPHQSIERASSRPAECHARAS